AQARVKANQERIDQHTKQLPSASGDREANLQQQIDLAHAQHEYDQDELDDVNEDLERSGGDPLSRIQRQFNQHEAAEHQYDVNHPQIGNYAEANYLAGNLPLARRTFPTSTSASRIIRNWQWLIATGLNW